jgi:hypothetical protein
LNLDGSRDDSKTTLVKPDEVTNPTFMFKKQTNEISINYQNTSLVNGKIIMNYTGKETENKYYYNVTDKTYYCLTNGVLEQFGSKIGDITVVNNKYTYDQCKQLAVSYFENSHSYKSGEFTMSSEQKN